MADVRDIPSIRSGAPADHPLRFQAPHAHLSSVFGNDWLSLRAEAFARFFGTPTFLVAQTVIVGVWMAAILLGFTHFDRYPFILLNLAFSLQAAYAAPLILLAQTRQADRDKALAAAVGPGRWDVCLIDCPPSLGLLTINALVAARSLLVPLQCEFFALEGMSQLLQTVDRVRARFNPDLSILGIALTMYDRRNRLSEQVAEDVRAVVGDLVFKTAVPRNVRLSEAPSHGLPALVYDQRCPGSEAYIALASEMIGRLPMPAAAA